MPTAVKNAREIIATIDDFRTLARKTKQELLPPQVGYAGQNIRFNEEYGSFEKRKSRAKYVDMATLGTSPITFADRYYKNSDSTKTLIIAYSTLLKIGDDDAGTFDTNIETGLTTGLRWKSLTFKDYWYGCNGTDNPRFYDGSNVEEMGSPQPDAVTVHSFSGTGLTGDYYYKITYLLNDYQEGSASDASAKMSPSNQGVKLTIPVSGNSRVTKRYLYRTKAGGSIYYFNQEIDNNTDTTVTDTTADTSLDTTILAPTDYGVPGAFKYMCLHKSRIFGFRIAGNLSRVIYSDLRSGTSYPDVFPANNYFDIIKDNGEEGTVIMEDNFGQLICMKPSAVVKISTDTDDPVGWSGFTDILSVHGCEAPYSAVKTHIGIIYLSRFAERRKRFMRWTGSSSEPVFEELEPILSSIRESRIGEVVGHYHNGCYYLAYTEPTTGNAYNDRLLIIDLATGAWIIDKKNIDCFSSWNSGTDEGELYTGTSDATGFVYREDTENQDLLIRYKSDIDLGTLTSNLTSGGTEESPTLSLNSGVTDDVGAKIVSTVTDIVSTLTGDEETVAPSGLYTSPVLEVNAKNLLYVYWTAAVGSYGTIYFYIRTGATEALCEAASWSGPYTSSGSDISAITAARYIQYKVRLSILGANVSNYADVVLSRGSSPDDYVIKITLGLGVLAESSIEMFYTSNWLDFGWLNPYFKRTRKHFHQVRIDFERTEESGTLTFGYYLDGSSTRTDKDFAFSTYATKGYAVYQFPIATFAKRIKYRLYHNDDIYSLKIKAVHWCFTAEPRGEIF